MAKIDETELKALLAEEIRSAVTNDATELSPKRDRAMEYYRGEMRDTPAMRNRSKVVSRDVADTIGWMLPGIIRVFTASDKMAEYEPVGRGDEQFADQASDYINYVFNKDNEGYRILWNATHDSLLQGNGIVKHYWDDSEECDYAKMSGMTAEQIALLEQDGVEVTGQKKGQPQYVIDPQTGQQTPIETFDIKTKRVVSTGRVQVECIEPENFLMDKDAVCIGDARFVAHRDEVTRSDLVKMGFDRELVEGLSTARTNFTMDNVRNDGDGLPSNSTAHESMRLVELFECYIKLDVDGDGIAEVVRAYYAGQSGAGELLDWEVWDDDIPFTDIPCEPVPHRFDARSVADETMDIQRIKTVLTRQMLDNLYASALPQMEVEEGSVTNPEALVNPKFGQVIWRKKGSIAAAPVNRFEVPFVADKIFPALEYFDQVVEKRTGVSRATMALDPETLQNQTATASQNQKDAAYSQIELIARNQAELGWRRVFKQLLRLVVKHQDRPRTIRLRDQWVDMDPRYWNAQMDVSINVGLGTGSRDRDMAMLNNIFMTQAGVSQSLAAAGFQDRALIMIPKMLRTATKMAESSGLHDPYDYYPEITDQDVQQMQQEMANKPDPQVQIEQAKLQVQMQADQAKMQLEQQKMQMEAQAAAVREQAQMNADMITKDKDRENALIIAQQQPNFDAQKMAEDSRNKQLDREQQMQIEMMKLGAAQQQTDQKQAHEAEMADNKQFSDERRDAVKASAKPAPAGTTGKKAPAPAPKPPASRKKKIVRAPDGAATGVVSDTGEKWNVVRDAEGNLTGMEKQ